MLLSWFAGWIILTQGDLPYWRIGQKYGMTENAVKQFAWRSKGEIGERRAELLVGLRAACNGALQYRVNVLKQIITETSERLADLEELWVRQEGWTVAGHAVWNAYHRTWCRYRELQAVVIAQLQKETDPRRFEEAVVDLDQLFDPVGPRCKESRSVDLIARSTPATGELISSQLAIS